MKINGSSREMLESAAEQFGGKEEQEIKNICLVSHFPIVEEEYRTCFLYTPTLLQLRLLIHTQCKILTLTFFREGVPCILLSQKDYLDTFLSIAVCS